MGLTTTIHRKITSRLSARLKGENNNAFDSTRLKHDAKFPERSSINPVSDLPQGVPTPYQCSVHLRLMKVFAHLREDVKRTKGLLSRSEDDQAASYSSNDDEVLLKLQDTRWNVYVHRAAQRFEIWWKAQMACRSGVARTITIKDLLTPGEIETRIQTANAFDWTQSNVLPVDVLMVLHSYMLNPRRFLEDCIRFDMLSLWKSGMPWDLVDLCFRLDPLEYHPGTDAEENWEKLTGCSWDNLNDDNDKHQSAIEKMQSTELSTKKLQKSLKDLRKDQIPLQGTILSYNGMVQFSSDDSSLIPFENSFANTVMQTELGAEILDLISQQEETTTNTTTTTIQSLKHLMIKWLNNPTNQKSINYTLPPASPPSETPLSKQANSSIDLFLSSHSHPGIFSLDLAAATNRQTIFIDAMSKLSWIYTPALPETLTHLIQKYVVFIKLIAKHPSKIAVPTHAVDLSWHTHQLSPSSYYSYTVNTTRSQRGKGKEEFIDHDDKISDTVLTDAFEWTRKAYGDEVGTDDTKNTYSQCLCWHCMTLESIAITKKKENNDVEHMVLEWIAVKQHEMLEDDYARAVKRVASKRIDGFDENKKVDRVEFLKGYKWLYPNAVPVLESKKGKK